MTGASAKPTSLAGEASSCTSFLVPVHFCSRGAIFRAVLAASADLDGQGCVFGAPRPGAEGAVARHDEEVVVAARHDGQGHDG